MSDGFMTAQQETEKALFQTRLEKLFQGTDTLDPLHKVRAKAWDHFLELGLPTRHTEVFRYIKLRNLFSKQYQMAYPSAITSDDIYPFIYRECLRSVLVFVNGYYVPSLSHAAALPSKVTVTSLNEAAHTYRAFLNNQWAKSMKEDIDPFVILNAALHPHGAFIYIPPNTIVESPIQILHINDSPSDSILMPRLHLLVGKGSSVDIVVSHKTIGEGDHFVNAVTELVLEEASRVRLAQSLFYDEGRGWHFEALRATVKKNGNLKAIHATNGSETIRHDYRVALNGENGEASLNGLWMLDDNREAHSNIFMDHQAPHCRSLQLFKGALNDFSRSSFEGKIFVRQAAQKTEAFQLNKNLLLSERAHANSKPNLEIFADDVKASHGATVGQLDKEQLFYMKARGIDTSTAKNLMVYGFCQDILDQMMIPSMRHEVANHIQSYL